MKTPKRNYENLKIVAGEVPWGQISFARWKRKNRTAQLKRSLTRYKNGTNLPFYCHELHAYLLLQQLSLPSKKATAAEWNFYILELTEIRRHIEEAMMQARRDEQQKREEEKQKATCISCRFFTPYNDGDTNGRCMRELGTYCTQDACSEYMRRKEQA